jgi:hypothetical protein
MADTFIDGYIAVADQFKHMAACSSTVEQLVEAMQAAVEHMTGVKAASLEHPTHGGPLGPAEWDTMEASTLPPFLSNELDKLPSERKNDRYFESARFALQECLWKQNYLRWKLVDLVLDKELAGQAR